MRRYVRAASVLMTFGALLCACNQRQKMTYPATTYVTLFEYPLPGGDCGVVAMPYHAWVADQGEIVWDVVNEACQSAGEATLEFAEPNLVGSVQSQSQHRKKVKIKPNLPHGPHKYSVKLGKFTHDPEYEIWPPRP